VTLAVAVVGALQVGTPAWAAYARTVGNSSDTLAARTYFTCVNAGYDGSAAAPGTNRSLRTYALQESTGTTAANTGSQASADGTYQGTATFTASGNATCGSGGTRAATFDGTSTFVNTTTQVGALADTTVEVWFKTTDSNGGRLIGLGDSSKTNGQPQSTATERTLFLTATGQVGFGFRSSAGTATSVLSPATYRDGAWHLATAVTGTGGTSLYVDGALAKGVTTTPAATAAAMYVRIGWDTLSTVWPSAPTDEYFAGSLAFAGLWDRALPAATVAAHWTAGT
jgi:hypothetical protein